MKEDSQKYGLRLVRQSQIVQSVMYSSDEVLITRFLYVTSLRGNRSRTKRNKFGPRKGVFHSRAGRKMGRGQKDFALARFFARPNVKN